jgi:hypothetical protein
MLFFYDIIVAYERMFVNAKSSKKIRENCYENNGLKKTVSNNDVGFLLDTQKIRGRRI